MRAQFIQGLEPFILSGQLKKFIIPEKMINMIINHYDSSESYQIMEKII